MCPFSPDEMFVRLNKPNWDDLELR
jgi:hypothetical protein